MALKEHPDYKEEKNRLDYTVKYVESAIEAADNNRKHFREDMRQAFIDLDPTDSSLSYSKIMLNAKFLDTLEKNYGGLVKAKKKPYFCRIDFKPDGSSKTNRIYIGKTSLLRAEDYAPLIVDWRSPIASVYYDGRLGRVSYQTPEGEAPGELELKRQYTINDSKLQNIMDVDITTTDTFLQAALGENRDNKLKSKNQDLNVRIESLTHAVDSDKKLIDEYTAKIRSLEKQLEGHEKLMHKVFELEESLLKERQQNNQANIKLENERANVSELTKQVEMLEKNHKKTLKQKTEELLVSKDQKILEVRMECQAQLEKMQESYTKKVSTLLDKIENLQQKVQ